MANPSTNKKRAVLRARRKKINKIVKAGMIYIRSTFNNVNITVSDNEGKVVAWASAGSVGFKGTKKSTPFAATQTAKTVIEKIKEMGFEEGQIIVNGVGNGREAAVRAFAGSGINITNLKDTTPVPHNGCRPKKPRRV
ncbi:MAG TPA: 30S ribosomal protein S11 [bacterium]|jgi:small subunit ribosomal protein S11|nr:30S ribosomal protein S11 [bacterium]HOR57250.1 30S ribosomal protein S11 [bacterium]HPL55917.1 30S ribosomal protein S11 [bacterium]HPM27588.1 30S ribosomal protein S11 [bacterium]